MTKQDTQLAARFQGCLATSARRLDRAIKAHYDDAFRPTGLKSTQVTLLVYIAGSDTPRAADLTAPMGIDQTTLSRNIDRLISLGLVETETAEDARTKLLRLTKAGRAALRRALPLWQQAQAQTESTLGSALSNALVKSAQHV